MMLQVEMQLPGAGWGVLNITSAGLKAWSFTDTVTFAARRVHPEASLVLHCGRMPSSYHGIVACSGRFAYSEKSSGCAQQLAQCC